MTTETMRPRTPTDLCASNTTRTPSVKDNTNADRPIEIIAPANGVIPQTIIPAKANANAENAIVNAIVANVDDRPLLAMALSFLAFGLSFMSLLTVLIVVCLATLVVVSFGVAFGGVSAVLIAMSSRSVAAILLLALLCYPAALGRSMATLFKSALGLGTFWENRRCRWLANI